MAMNKYNPNIHNRRSIRLKGYDYSQAGLYFITICCENRIRRFGKVVDGKMILNEYGKIARSEWLKLEERFPSFQLDVFQIMPNHFHAIIALASVGATLAVAQNDGNSVAQNNGNSVVRDDVMGAKNDDNSVARDDVMVATNDGNSVAQNDGNSVAKNDDNSVAQNDGNSVAQNDDNSVAQNDDNSVARDDVMGATNDDNSVARDDVMVAQNDGDNGCWAGAGTSWAGASPAPTRTVGDIIGAYKSLVVNECLKIFKSKNEIMGKFWQRNYYEHIIRNEQSYQRISQYIMDNPKKWNEDKFYNQ